jgi:hypothetical protein
MINELETKKKNSARTIMNGGRMSKEKGDMPFKDISVKRYYDYHLE